MARDVSHPWKPRPQHLSSEDMERRKAGAGCCSKSVQNLAKLCPGPRTPEDFFLSPRLCD